LRSRSTRYLANIINPKKVQRGLEVGPLAKCFRANSLVWQELENLKTPTEINLLFAVIVFSKGLA
jgi:hypothetical protein